MKKNENDFKISVSYRGKVYLFDYGSQAYIFHTGIYNDIPKKYGLKGLREYTNLVHNCYVEDSNRTPLGELSALGPHFACIAMIISFPLCYIGTKVYNSINKTNETNTEFYVAQQWKKMRNKHSDEILAEFYNYAM